MLWRSNPAFKLEISGQTYINNVAFTIVEKRVENNLSYLVLQVDDYQSERFVDVFDTFDSLTLSLRYGSDSWTKVFTGNVTTTKPHLGPDGELLEVGAWGEGKALLKTHCDESYGVESIDNSALDTPTEIIEDLITNHINKEFGGAASGYAIVDKVETIIYPDAGPNTFSITHLNSQYLDNFVNVNRVCSLTNAYAASMPEVSIHWFVDPDKGLYVKKIDDDHSDGTWDRYYGGSQANATIEVSKDMILYDFAKNVEEYANSIVLSSQLRKPSEDYWTEDNGGQALWGDNGNVTVSDVVATSAVAPEPELIVGSHCIELDQTSNVVAGLAYYPAGQNAAWDLTKICSVNTVGSLNLWLLKNEALGANTTIMLCTGAADYFTTYGGLDQWLAVNAKWYYISLPVGPFHYSQQDQLKRRWVPSTALADWANINYIQFQIEATDTHLLYVDDMHFAGTVVREARDTSEITAHDVHQKIIRNDTAVNDSLKESDDTGTAAQLAYAELLRRSQTPIVGMIQIPMLPDLLPGQTLHVHACLKKGYKTTDAGAFRIDKDMRVKDLRHVINTEKGFTTIVNLTDDVSNTHAFGVSSQYALLKQHAGALKHSEARNLKGGALDNLIPRLSVNY